MTTPRELLGLHDLQEARREERFSIQPHDASPKSDEEIRRQVKKAAAAGLEGQDLAELDQTLGGSKDEPSDL